MQTASFAADIASPLASWRVNHVGILVDDIDAPIAWYTETFGFRSARRWSFGDKWFGWLSPAGGGDVIIELLAGPEGNRPSHEETDALKQCFRPHARFRVDSFDDTITELMRRGVNIVSKPYDVKPVSRQSRPNLSPADNRQAIGVV
jgi:catechol 2,3-dioxygenase-like lactoylglutathione lyase family enzyme